MPSMTATVARNVDVHGCRYRAAAGETVEARWHDVPTLKLYGFHLDDAGAVEGDEESDDLEDRTVDELRELAAGRQIRGRSKMDREELLEALRTDPGQEA